MVKNNAVANIPVGGAGLIDESSMGASSTHSSGANIPLGGGSLPTGAPNGDRNAEANSNAPSPSVGESLRDGGAAAATAAAADTSSMAPTAGATPPNLGVGPNLGGASSASSSLSALDNFYQSHMPTQSPFDFRPSGKLSRGSRGNVTCIQSRSAQQKIYIIPSS